MSKLLLPLAGLTLVLAAGCESPGYKPEPVGPGVSEDVWKDKVHMSQSGWQTVQVVQVREAVENDLMKVQVDLRNRNQGTRSIRGRFDWFDANGMKLDSPNDGWKSYILHAAEVTTITATATNPRAKSWRLNVNTWQR